MHERSMGRDGTARGALTEHRRRPVAREHMEIFGREIGQHHRHRPLVEIFDAGRANAQADGADPFRDARAHLEQGQDLARDRGVQVGEINEAQARAGRESIDPGLRIELEQTLLDRGTPIGVCSMRVAKAPRGRRVGHERAPDLRAGRGAGLAAPRTAAACLADLATVLPATVLGAAACFGALVFSAGFAAVLAAPAFLTAA